MNRKKIAACAACVCCAAGIFLLALSRMQAPPLKPIDAASVSTASSSAAVKIDPPTKAPSEDLSLKTAPSEAVSKPAEEKEEAPAITPKPAQSTPASTPAPKPQPQPEQKPTPTPEPAPAPTPEPPAQPTPEPQPPAPQPPANPEPQHYHGNGSDGGTCPVCGMGYSPSINMDGLTPEDDLEDLS